MSDELYVGILRHSLIAQVCVCVHVCVCVCVRVCVIYCDVLMGEVFNECCTEMFVHLCLFLCIDHDRRSINSYHCCFFYKQHFFVELHSI